MAAVTERRRRGSEDGRNAKKRKCSRSKNKPKKSLYWWLIITLLFVSPGAASLTVEGRKGGSITLPCSLTNREDLTPLLTFGSIKAYGRGQDEHFRGRVHKSGSCDLILQDLKTTDSGKYMADVYDHSGLISSNSYDIHVKVNLTGQKGEELMFELPREAENVMHFTDPHWTEVWRRGQGVLTDRLAIKSFTSSDAGLYRVLNSTGGILVTVTVTESKDKLNSTHDELYGTEKNHIVIGVLVVVVAIAFAVIMKRPCQNRSNCSYQGVSTHRGTRSPNNSTGCLVGLQQICRGSCQHVIPDSVS